MIVPPIVLEDRDVYLQFYDSVSEAIANLDLDDVLDREFLAYDSRGYPLSVEPTTEPGWVAKIEAIEAAPSHEDRLRAALLRALRLKGVPITIATENLPLAQLLEHALEHARHKHGYDLP